LPHGPDDPDRQLLIPERRPMDRKSVTLHKLREMHKAGEKISMLTCYDSAFAALLDDAGVDCLLGVIRWAWCCRAEARPMP
jgi:hypothetical protein